MDLPQLRIGDVSVDLGGGDGGVSEELLDGADIGAIGEQGGGEGVTECVGRDILNNSGAQSVGLDHIRDEEARQADGLVGKLDIFDILRVPVMPYEERGEVVDARREVVLDCITGRFSQIDNSDFSSFSTHRELTIFCVYILSIQCR